jgi:solute carrier family 50 protein (sugar transporter)
MVSASKIVLEYLCPVAGVITANVMFSAPVRDTAEASRKKGTLGDLNPTPWVFMLGNTFGWITYSILIDNLFIFFANAPGFILSVWLNLQAAKLQYASFRSKEMTQSLISALQVESRRKVMPVITEEGFSEEISANGTDDEECRRTVQDEDEEKGSPDPSSQPVALDYAKIVWDVTSQTTPAPAPHENMVIGMVVIWMAIISLISFASTFSDKTIEVIAGTCVNLNLVFFYGAPLSTIWTVLRTRSSASVHIPTMLTNTANGAFWFAYGLAVMDPFVAVPNGLGAGLGVAQFFLCVMFPRRHEQTSSEEDNNNNNIGDQQQQSREGPLVDESTSEETAEGHTNTNNIDHTEGKV